MLHNLCVFSSRPPAARAPRGRRQRVCLFFAARVMSSTVVLGYFPELQVIFKLLAMLKPGGPQELNSDRGRREQVATQQQDRRDCVGQAA